MPCERIVLIESDPGIRAALKEGLADEGLPFCAVPDAIAGLELLESGCVPSVVVLDYPYPPGASAQALELLCREPRLAGVAVFVITAIPTHMLPGRVDALLDKPFRLEEFLATVRRLLERGRAPRPGEALRDEPA
jgi:DNA-binding response OmpR family regulator